MKIAEYEAYKYMTANYSELRKSHWPTMIGQVDAILKDNGDVNGIEQTVDFCYAIMQLLDQLNGIINVSINIPLMFDPAHSTILPIPKQPNETK